jgi:TetR/AcrR family transcriptional regulator, transcriptional repressor for nem operon
MLVNGYNATSVDQICEACGIKKGSFYHHFDSKEQLAVEAVEKDWEGFKAVLDEAFSPAREPLDRIRTYIAGSLASQRACQESKGFVTGCPLFALGAEIGPQEPRLRQKVDEHLSIMARYFESALREGHALGQLHAPDAKSLAWMLLTFSEGALTMARIRNDLQPLIEMQAGVFRLIGATPAASAA